MSYSPLNFLIVVLVYVRVTSPKAVCPRGITLSQQGAIFRVPISIFSALSTKKTSYWAKSKFSP